MNQPPPWEAYCLACGKLRCICEHEVVDGVVYVRRPCVQCGVSLSVAEASVRVSDSTRWPRCTDCIREARS